MSPPPISFDFLTPHFSFSALIHPPPLPLLPAPLFLDAFGPNHTDAVGLEQDKDPDLLGGDSVQHLA